MGTAERLVIAAGTMVLGMGISVAQAETEITLWSHWADHESKVAFVEKAAKSFEAKNPGVKVKITWYQQNPLYAALKVALNAGKGPDVFYAEVDQTEYIDNHLLLPLDDLLDWSNIEPWARAVWTFNGKAYGLPLEVQTNELYYNKDLLKKFGVTLPADGQLSQAAFEDLVDKAVAAGITPLGQGVGDRKYPGFYFTYNQILQAVGVEDYGKLLRGELKHSDPRVVKSLEHSKKLIDKGLYPKSIATLKLGESHQYFYSNPGSVMLAMGSFYTTRAFNPAEKGGQPENFPLGIMKFPAVEGAPCNECKVAAIGGGYAVNAATKNPKLAAALLNEMTTPEMGTLWLTSTLVQSGVKGNPSMITGKYKPYFDELAARNTDVKYFIGLPTQIASGTCRDTLVQVMNTGFPAGLIGVKDAVAQIDAGCAK